MRATAVLLALAVLGGCVAGPAAPATTSDPGTSTDPTTRPTTTPPVDCAEPLPDPPDDPNATDAARFAAAHAQQRAYNEICTKDDFGGVGGTASDDATHLAAADGWHLVAVTDAYWYTEGDVHADLVAHYAYLVGPGASAVVRDGVVSNDGGFAVGVVNAGDAPRNATVTVTRNGTDVLSRTVAVPARERRAVRGDGLAGTFRVSVTVDGETATHTVEADGEWAVAALVGPDGTVAVAPLRR